MTKQKKKARLFLVCLLLASFPFFFLFFQLGGLRVSVCVRARSCSRFVGLSRVFGFFLLSPSLFLVLLRDSGSDCCCGFFVVRDFVVSDAQNCFGSMIAARGCVDLNVTRGASVSCRDVLF